MFSGTLSPSGSGQGSDEDARDFDWPILGEKYAGLGGEHLDVLARYLIDGLRDC